MVLPYFTALVFGTMAPSLNLTEYKAYYDNVHIPLVKSLTGANFPVIHTRHYIGGNPVFANASAPVDWDSMAIMSFCNQTHALKFMSIITAPAAEKLIREDEHKFMANAPRRVIVGNHGNISWP
ncbi:hypothetical protein BDU57DRAFT_519570 [Ampelomyces quisqualis]|uniref:EthD domain-containing protein n=1 Tax=Ampelomyces quisqualis TaxID=50730 RepID=A0A6A5QI67_AMPQU|nr:hypothetical protein BDU57DRAFT_519570 [Ampelomyces quisqualis]